MRIVVLLGLLISTALRAQVWEPLNGPHTTEVTLIETSSNGLVLLGTAQGTFRSPDNGDTWSPMSIGPSGTYISKIVVAPNGHLFARGDSMYKSIDDGLTWSGIATWPLTIMPSLLMVDSAGIILTSTSWPPTLHTSMDEGDTWTSTPTPDIINSLVDGPADTLYAGTGSGMIGSLLRSDDGGATWVVLNPTASRAIGVNNNGDIFALFNGGLNRSTDGGMSWNLVDLPVVDGLVDVEWTSANDMIAATGTLGVYTSSNNGDTWSSANFGLYSWFIYSVAVNNSDHLFVATKAGAFRSTDNGISWTMVYSGDDGSHISCLLTNGNNNYFAGVTSVGVFRSQDQGVTWHAANRGMENGTVTGIAMNSSGQLFASVRYLPERNGIYRSIDNGENWMKVTDSTVFNMNGVAISSNDDIFAVGDQPSVIRSIDNGATWSDVSDGVPCSAFFGLAISPLDIVLLGGQNCATPVLASMDNGANWPPYSAGLWTSTVPVIKCSSDNVLFAAQSTVDPHLFRSVDNAQTWQPITNGLTALGVQTLECHPVPGLILAGTPFGAFISGSYGDEWWPFNDGLTNTDVTAFAIDQDGLALAGTDGGGVFRASLPVSVPEVAVNDFTLEQNTPNPCDGNTTITYSLRTAAHVQLTLLDAHGRTVAQLVDATQPPGRNTVDVTTARLAPGLYAYALTVDGKRMTKRMMVVH